MRNCKEFNHEIESVLFHDRGTNTLHGKICIVCDKLMNRQELCQVGLKTFLKYAEFLKGDSSLCNDLRQCYSFTIPGDGTSNKVLEKCLLSPRSKLVQTDNQKRYPKVMCCKECKSGLSITKLKAGALPRFAIANNMTIGTPPECLSRLNEIELALLSQARFRGHLFTYWGGCHRSIKGWHSFYEVDPNHTTAVLQEVVRFTEAKNIAVVLCGPFTTQQKEKVLRKVQVNVQWVLEGFAWLKRSNRLYEDAPIPKIEAPTIIDNSHNMLF